MSKFYSIKARANAPRSAEVFIYGDIGESWDGETVAARDFVREFAAIDADEITIRINSYGGSVTDGLAIHNAIKRHPAAVAVEIDGIAASIASLIAMAGNTVSMADNALLMVHAPWGFAAGNAADMREMADVLDKYADAMTSAYVSKTGKGADEIGAMLKDGKDHWFSAAEAAAFGLIDEITVAMPVAASLDKQFDLSRYARFKADSSPAAAAAKTHEVQPMPAPTPTPAATPTAADLEAVKAQAAREAVAADAQRREAIAVKFQPALAKSVAGAADLLASCQNDINCTVEAAADKLLALYGADASPVAGHISIVEDERDVKMAGMVDAILARAGVAGVKADASNPFRGMKLLDMARASLESARIDVRGMDQMKIVAQAFTQGTSDFPVLLENAMHKTLLAAFARAQHTWNRFCATGSVSDFRAHNRYQLGSFGNLDSVNEFGEFKNKSIPDGRKESITATTKGNIINLSRQAIINDDLGAFIGLANMLGAAAARTVEADVYALLALNDGLGPVMSDGKTLFHADHANIGTGAALSMASIDADRVVMASQMDISGNDYLDLRPSVLLVPIGLGGTARSINSAEYDPDTANKLQKPNVVNGLYRDIVDTPRLSGTRRYSFADPMEAPVLEVAFLDGNQEPYLEVQNGFDVDGALYKVRFDYAVGAVGYQGAVTNAGA